MKNPRKKYFHINSLEKGTKVLELLAEMGELSVTKVAEHLGLNRTGSHRFLATLRELGYVEKNQDSRYQLTFKILELGMKTANRFEIRREARPYMQELSLAFRETINLGFRDGLEILHLDKIESLEILRMDSPVGSRAPAYCTALGKASLAFLPQNELDVLLNGVKLKPHGPNTITSKKKLRQELERIRNQGYAIDDEELAFGLRCVAAPIFDHTGLPRYSISVAGPAMRLTEKRMQQIQKAVKKVCGKLSQRWGKPGKAVSV
ncbi:MAG: IclR family transcriptional regulator [Desulfobacterales bacterium]|nr:MAG: IclR family transcriptional regulator [Desulfobacterales bacterium]